MKKNTKLTIIDLVHVVKWEDVKKSIKFHYPTDKNDYKSLFLKLKTFVREEPKHKEELEVFVFGEPSRWPEDFALKQIEEENYYGIHTVRDKKAYCMSFRPWKEVANVPISEDTLHHVSFVDIVAHFIWEITFYGNEEEMKEIGKEIENRVEDFKKEMKCKKTKKDEK